MKRPWLAGAVVPKEINKEGRKERKKYMLGGMRVHTIHALKNVGFHFS